MSAKRNVLFLCTGRPAASSPNTSSSDSQREGSVPTARVVFLRARYTGRHFSF